MPNINMRSFKRTNDTPEYVCSVVISAYIDKDGFPHYQIMTSPGISDNIVKEILQDNLELIKEDSSTPPK